jgi:hypothetical protein
MLGYLGVPCLAGLYGSSKTLSYVLVFVLTAARFASAQSAQSALANTGAATQAEHSLDFWSVKPIQSVPRPSVRQLDWVKQPLDYHVLATLEQKAMTPAEEADPRTLARRVFYDLTGLPPTYQELETFLGDRHPDAYRRLVDRLLDSPRFGERMASLWLHLSRYAEDQAHQVGNDIKHFYPNAYRYRQWVIDAFNQDMPYQDFIRLQLAGDLYDATHREDLVATGFLGLGHKFYNRGRLDVKAEEWADQVDTVMRTFQGLTVACARCHDHKFDPISVEDYHAVAGIFASTELVNVAYDKPEDQLTKEDRDAHRHTAHVVPEKNPEDLPIFLRGNVDQKGEKVPRGFLSWLNEGHPIAFDTLESGRRELAEAIASPDNPLTARVYMNRLWSLFFGEGLVKTTSNFGKLGAKPSHPELLDDLAFRFTASGGLTKPMVREMVLSATYRQASVGDPVQVANDPGNQWLARMNMRRMTVEMWRDTILQVSGNLQHRGGASLELDDQANHRRTVFGRISRLQLNPLLVSMDYPDANVHAADRSETTTPLQKLQAMNSDFAVEQATHLAADLSDQKDVAHGVDLLFRRVLARHPDDTELEMALDYFQANPHSKRWVNLAHALMMSNEMLYID